MCKKKGIKKEEKKKLGWTMCMKRKDKMPRGNSSDFCLELEENLRARSLARTWEVESM